MATKTIRVCDGCAHEVPTNEHNNLPDGWATVTVYARNIGQVRCELCVSCVRSTTIIGATELGAAQRDPNVTTM